ncbi:MAG TPA: lamin tail domain-containing protein, partial [Myxococcus sp.]|nr:lamin tail domain-containing protein [Myxococcus sp.]
TAAGLEGGTSATFAVAPAAAASVEVAGLPETTTAGVARSAEVTLRDEFGNVATGYTGTLAVSSSDAGASLPAGHAFTAADAGRFTFTGITLRRAGTQRVTLQDTAVAALTAGRDVAVAAAAPAALAFVTVPTGGSVRTALGPVTVALQDAFGNLTPAGAPAVTLALVQAGATLGGVTEVAPVAGLATFSNLQVDGEGGFQLRATASGLTGATSGGTLDIVDDVAPARPALATGASSARSVTVTWTAVGDDRDAGRATSQELRYADAPIVTDEDFAAATPVQGLGAPAVAGTAESFTLTGLLPNRTYHVALRVTDNHGQSSRSASLPVQTVNAQVASVVFSTEPADGTAGQPLAQVRVSLLDDQGDVVTTASSPVTLRMVGMAFFVPVTVEAVAGVATFTGLRVNDAGQWAFRAHANNLVSEQSRRFTIQPAAASRLTLTGLVAPVIAGAAGSVEVVARDEFGNVATGYTGRVHFESSDAEAELPEEYTFTAADAGRHVFSGVVLYTAGDQRVSVTDVADATLTAGFEVEVVGDSAARLELTGLPAAVVAGDAPAFTVTARDRHGNIASGYRGTVRFTSGDAQAGLPADYIFNTEDAGQQRFVATLATAGTQSVTVTDTANPLLTATASTEVAPGAATRMELALSASTAAAGEPVSATVTLRDVFDNVATGYRGTVALGIPEDRDATSEPESHPFTEADAGRFSFSVRLARVRLLTEVVARDTQNEGLTASASLQVRPGVLAELRVTSADGATTAGEQRSFEVAAYDRFGNLKTDYSGTVRTTSSDAQATPLEEHAYVPAEEGRHTFAVTFRTAGTQSATFTDAALNIAGSHEFTVEAAEPTRLVVVSAPETGTVRAALARTRVALRDAFGNTPRVSAPAVSLALEGAPEGVVLSGTRTASPVDGVAAFEDLSLNEEGSFVLVASTENPALGTANIPVAITDNLAPAPAAQLDAVLEEDDSVRLSWRATGDDGALGRAARYELRFSDAVIDESNFGQAAQLTTGTPGDSGTLETALADGLTLGRTYYFGLRIIDGVGNASALTLTSFQVPDACAGYECAVRPPVCGEDGESLVTFEGTCVVRDGEPTCEYSPVSTPCPGEGAVCFEDACGTATPPAPGELFISEVMHRPGAATEYIELSSRVDRLLNLDGLALRYDDGVSPREFVLNPDQGHAVVGPNSYIVLARNADTETNGGVPVNFSYGDALTLGDSGQLSVRIGGAGGTVLDSLNYTPSFPQTTGRSMNLSSTVLGSSASQFSWYWCDSSADIVSGGDRGTPGLENETCGVAITSPVDYCAIQSPKTIAAPVLVNSPQTIYSRFYEDGVTNRHRGGNDGFPYITAELGYGTSAATPESWTWVPAPFNPGYGGATPNDDETMGTLSIPTAGNYLYGFRYRFTRGPAEAQEWVYCDQNNVVASSGSANYGTVSAYALANHVVISEVSGRGTGTASTVQEDEFIELHNPTDADIDLTGWTVQYKAATTTDYSANQTFTISAAGGPVRVIRAHGYLLLGRSAYTGAATLDQTYGNINMAGATTGGGNVRINRPNGSGGFVEVDRLAWGNAIGPEGPAAAPAHPAPGGSIERKAVLTSTPTSMSNDTQDGLRGNGLDMDNNSADFVTRASRTPQNSSSTERP